MPLTICTIFAFYFSQTRKLMKVKKIMSNIKLNIFKYSPLLLVFFILCSSLPQDAGKKQEVLLGLIMQGIESNHFSPKAMDDDFSENAFKLYIKRLDFSKRFLLESDVDDLEEYEEKIDDEVKNTSYVFFDKSYSIVKKRIKEAEGYYKEILDKPFDFSKDETIEQDADKLDYVETTAELKDRWRQNLKYQTLTRVVNKLEQQEKAKKDNDTSVEIKSLAALEEEARKAVRDSQDDFFKQLNQLEREDYLAVYINSIVNTYDPHTEYFPPKDKENFDIAMSGQLEGIGAQLMEKNGNIEVSYIVPGSASWKQGELEAGDVILSVGQGEKEPVDIVGMRLDKAVQMIRGKKGSEVRLTVKKIDGSVIIIPIIRDIVILEETFAKSAIIQDQKTGQKYGYIQLPSFYADFGGKTDRSSAEDVRQEVERLQKEGVSGIVFDLRNNGGGSLQDVVEMTGLFIKEGPVVQVKARNSKPYVLSDKDPSIQYDGPLVLLVNEFSASASEIMAAAIQDYGRGIVIGSNSFGKGTVQQFFELDKFLTPAYSDVKPLGSLKLTTQKFYRINGGATQLEGVKPDIILPDAYSYLEIGERDLDYAMPWTKIDPITYSPWNKTYSTNMLLSKSRSRTNTNSTFHLVEENAKRLKRQSEDTQYSLNMQKYRAKRDKATQEAEKYKNIEKEISEMKTYSTRVYSEAYESDSSAVARRTEWLKNLNKDAYIYEAVNVINDMRK